VEQQKDDYHTGFVFGNCEKDFRKYFQDLLKVGAGEPPRLRILVRRQTFARDQRS